MRDEVLAEIPTSSTCSPSRVATRRALALDELARRSRSTPTRAVRATQRAASGDAVRPDARGDGGGRSAHDRGRHAGSGADRAGGHAVAWRVRRVLGGVYGRRVGGRVRQGQQRQRRARRGARAARRGVSASTSSISPTASTTTRSTARLRRADVVVDAMFGTGFRGALEGDAAWLARRRRPRALVGRGRHPVGCRRRDRRGARRDRRRRRTPCASPR